MGLQIEVLGAERFEVEELNWQKDAYILKIMGKDMKGITDGEITFLVYKKNLIKLGSLIQEVLCKLVEN